MEAALVVRRLDDHVERGSVENFGYDESGDGGGGSENLSGPDELLAPFTDDDSDADGLESENSGWASAPEEGADEESGQIASGRFGVVKKKSLCALALDQCPIKNVKFIKKKPFTLFHAFPYLENVDFKENWSLLLLCATFGRPPVVRKF